MDQNQCKRIGAHLAGELASTLCGEPGAAIDVEAALEQATGAGYLLTVKCEGVASGNIIAWVVAHVAEAAARVATGTDEPSQEEVLALVRNRGEIAVANLEGFNECAGLRLTVTGVVPGNPPVQGARFTFVLPTGAKGSVAVLTHIGAADTTARSSSNLDLVLDVELPLVVRFGRTVMNLKTLTGLGPGSIVDMGRSPDDPVELLVSDKVVAYGEVVIVDGSYGLRITDIVSRNERSRSMGVR